MMSVVTLGVALVVALAVLAQLARWIHARPQRGVLLLAALTPLHGIVAILPLSGVLTVWKEGLLALTLGCAMIRARHAPRRHVPVHLPWWPAMAGLVVFGCASALLTFGLFGLVAIKVTFFYLVVLVALWLAPFDARDRDNLVTVIMAMGVLTSLVGLAQQAVGPAKMIELGYQYGMQVRAAGGLFRTFSTFNQPFPFALYVMLSLIVGGAVALADPRRRRNTIFLWLTPVMVLSMSTAIVRAALLGLAVGMVWLAIHRFRMLAGILAAGSAVVLLALPFVPSTVTDAIFSSSSLGERGDGWGDIISSIAVHPFGLGLGASGAAADRMSVAGGENLGVLSPNYQPDNYYVKILLELGPIGLWLLVAVLVAALVWTLRLSRVLPGQDGALCLGVSASVLAAMAASTVATYFEIFPLDFYFWLLLGVVGCAAAQHGSDSGRSPSVPAAAESRPMPVNS